MFLNRLIFYSFFLSFAAFGMPEADEVPQTETPSPQETKPDEPPGRNWTNIPLPLIGTSSLAPISAANPFKPLTPKQKVTGAISRTVGPLALLNRGFLAGMNQWRNRPEEWGQGWDAYGQRFGYRMARLASRQSIMLGFDLAMGTDQRYDRCNCTGFWPRTGQAFRRVAIARTDSGGETINAGRIAGAYGGAFIAYRVYPERFHTTSQALNSGSQYLLWRGVTNMVREFWPEIRRVVRIGPMPSSSSSID